MEKEYSPRLDDWLASKVSNEQLIITNQMQILMAKEVIKLCNKKIKPLEKAEKLALKKLQTKKKPKPQELA